jgi:hypothetical protein
LRGSAGFSPASLSSPNGKDARTKRFLKELKKPVQGIYWQANTEVKSQITRPAVGLLGVLSDLCD